MSVERAGLCLLFTLLFVTACSAQSVSAVGSGGARPELVIQDGHSWPVTSVSFSPDGRIIASGGLDQTIKLWDARSGRLIRSIDTETKLVSFSPDGNLLAATAADYASNPNGATLNLWDVRSGTVARKFECPDKGYVVSLAFSRSGKFLAAGTGNDSMHVWDLKTGQLVRSFHATRRFSGDDATNTNFKHIAFSPDERTIASGGSNQTAFLWSIVGGNLLRTFDEQGGRINAVAFSPDGSIVAAANNATVKLWDASTGKLLRELEADTLINDIAFGREGKTILGSENEGVVVLWDLESGHVVSRFEDTGSKVIDRSGDVVHSSILSIAISPDGETVAGGSDDRTLRLWSAKTGRLLRVFERHLTETTALAVDPFHNVVAIGQSEAGVSLLDAGTTQTLCRLEDSRNMFSHENKDFDQPFSFMLFSPDMRTVASWRKVLDEHDRMQILDNSVRVWDAVTGRLRASLKLEGNMFPEMAYSPDGKMLAVSAEAVWSSSQTIELLDVESGKKLRALRSHRSDAFTLAFSPDGKSLAVASKNAIRFLDVKTDTVLRVLRSGAVAVAFSPDGKLLASGGVGSDESIKIWDVASGALLRSMAYKEEGKSIGTLAFSPDGRTLISHTQTPFIKYWNVADGRLIKSVPIGTSVESLTVNPNGVVVAFTSAIMDSNPSRAPDRLTKILSPQGELVATVIGFGDGRWIAVTPEGYFDGTAGAWSQVNWRFKGVEVAPVEAFFNEFYYPGLLAEILEGKGPTAPADIADKDRRQADVRFVDSGDGTAQTSGVTARVLKVRLEVSERPPDKEHRTGSGARDVRLFRNGSLVRIWRGDVELRNGKTTLEANIPIVAGPNTLTAYAFNRDNVKSQDAELSVKGADSLNRAGTAYILAVGVNSYENSQYDLKYAAADARDFAEELRKQQTLLGKYSRVEVVTLNDSEATKANILAALKIFAGGTDALHADAPKSLEGLKRAEPEDAVVVYFAGHGTAQGSRFYLIPHDIGYKGEREALDAEGLQTILAHSISDEELQTAFEGLDAGQILLVIDACNSGQALEAEEKRRGPMNSRGLAQLAYEKGMYVLTAAQSYQAAQEASQLGHGLLTYALVDEGLKQGGADFQPKDGEVLLREWLDFAAARVPRMQIEEMKRAAARGVKLAFKDEERKLELSSRSPQVPRIFYRRELEALPFLVARIKSAP